MATLPLRGLCWAACLAAATAAQDFGPTLDLFAGPRCLPLQYAELSSGDVDGDGDADVVASHSNAFWFFENLGGGRVAGHEHVLSVDATLPLHWDGDGQLDLAVREAGAAWIHFGDGTFDLPVLAPVEPGLGGVRVLRAGDLDGDGQIDLLAGREIPDQLRAWMGDGAGGVAAAVVTPLQERVAALELGDLDTDGQLDAVLLEAPLGSLELTTHFGDGAGGFVPGHRRSLPGGSSGLQVGDLDGDGAVEVGLAVPATDVWVFPNDGSGALGSPQVLTLSANAGATFADLSGDGLLDLLTHRSTEDQVFLHRGDGQGSFGAGELQRTGDSPSDLHVLELDGDGLPDLAVSGGIYAGLSVHTGTGTGGLRLPWVGQDHGAHAGLDLGDLDGDGLLDAVLGAAFPSAVVVYPGTGGETFGEPVIRPLPGAPQDVAVGDVTGDDRPDVVVPWQVPGGGVQLLANDGSGGLLAPVFHPTGDNTSDVHLADIDEDGLLDVLALNRAGGSLSLLLADGTGGLGTPASWPLPFQPSDLDSGDLDGDGVPDVVVVAEGASDMTVLLGRGGGSGDLDLEPPVFIGPDVDGVGLGDVDLDGDLDAVLAVNASDRVLVHANDGSAGFAQAHNLASVINPTDVQVLDLDADGVPDLLTGGVDLVGVHRGRLLTTFWPVTAYTAHGGASVVAADLEGSGHLDLVTLDLSEGLGVVQNRRSPWTRVGGGVPGGPVLSAVGDLTPASPLTLSAFGGTPGGTLWLVLGLSAPTLPFAGGLLVPAVDVLLSLPLDGAGQLVLPTVWPGGIPAGLPFWVQPWLAAPHTPGEALLGVTG